MAVVILPKRIVEVGVPLPSLEQAFGFEPFDVGQVTQGRESERLQECPRRHIGEGRARLRGADRAVDQAAALKGGDDVAADFAPRQPGKSPPASPAANKQSWPGHWPRPSRLLTQPEAIDTVALLPDHPPASFTWRGVRRRVKRADGPERVFGEWWKRDPELAVVRDYFRIEDDAGERYWVYGAGDGEDPLTGSQRWFLHGIFG